MEKRDKGKEEAAAAAEPQNPFDYFLGGKEDVEFTKMSLANHAFFLWK